MAPRIFFKVFAFVIWSVGGSILQGGDRNRRRKTVQLPLCSPQIPLGLCLGLKVVIWCKLTKAIRSARLFMLPSLVVGAGYMPVSGRSCDRPSQHRFCLVSLCLSISECWDGSLYSKMLLHASHAAHQDQIKTPCIYVCYVWYVCKAATGRQSNRNK